MEIYGNIPKKREKNVKSTKCAKKNKKYAQKFKKKCYAYIYLALGCCNVDCVLIVPVYISL